MKGPKRNLLASLIMISSLTAANAYEATIHRDASPTRAGKWRRPR
jgi:hypothetical protein